MKAAKTACVTGGTSGIGLEVTRRLLKNGWSVIAVGLTEAHAAEAAHSLGSPEDLSVIIADVSQPAGASNMAEAVASRSLQLDLLVLSAGTISSGGIVDETFERWQKVMSTNVDSLFLSTKACLPFLEKAPAASIVAVSSVCALRPCASLSYSVSKAATDMFVRSTARELAQRGIRVNGVNPSVVRTNLQLSARLMDNKVDYEAWIGSMEPNHPLGRVGAPSDVAAAILFLCSDEATWITGASLPVDGGRSIG